MGNLQKLATETISLSGDVNFLGITFAEINEQIGKHSTAKIIGYISDEIGLAELNKKLYGSSVILTYSKTNEIIFSGVVSGLQIENENDVYYGTLHLISHTTLLDQKYNSRSYQDTSMSYRELIQDVLDRAGFGVFVSNVDSLSEKLPFPIIQYHETDWQFITRVSSHFGVSLFPHFKYGEPEFYLGLPTTRKTYNFEENYTSYGISDRYYMLGGQKSGYDPLDFRYYKVETKVNLDIGDSGLVDGHALRVVEKQTLFKNFEMVYRYTFSGEMYASQKFLYNEVFSGLTILGTVIGTENETLKIHLDIDDSQDISTAYSYRWVPTTGNLMYLMPQVGTRVSLYFSNQCESSGKAINCVRTNGDAEMMSDPSQRRLLTEHGKQVHLYPESLGFTSTREGTPLAVVFDDAEGVLVSSHNKLDVIAFDGIMIEAPTVVLSALSQVQLAKADIQVTGGGENVPYNVVADPVAYFDLFNLTQMQGDATNYTAWEFNYFPPFEDAPTKGKFNGFALVGKILGGVAVAVAVGALVFFTAGAALGAVPFIATGVATGIAATLGIGTGAVGLGVTAYNAYHEIQSGNAIPLRDYVMPTIRVGGVVMSAISLLTAPWTLPLALNNAAALLTWLLQGPGGGAGGLALASGGVVSVPLALESVDSILATLGFVMFAASGGSKGSRKPNEPKYKTESEARKAAKELGYKETNKTSDKCKIYENPKGNPRYITRDRKGHSGGAWKGANKVKDLGSRTRRTGTYDEFLNLKGD